MITDCYYKTRALLSSSIDPRNHNNHAFCRLLAPHIRFNSSHASELQLQNHYYHDEYHRFALVFQHVGSWDEEEKLLLVTVDWRKAKFGPNHPLTIYGMGELARTYMNQGRWNEAEELQMMVVNAWEEMFGSNHTITQASIGFLATMYLIQ